MTPTVYAAHIQGTHTVHLSLHTSYEGAVSAVLRAGARIHQDRFGWTPPDLRPLPREYGSTAAAALRLAEERLFGAAGLRTSVEELPVELDAEEAAAGAP